MLRLDDVHSGYATAGVLYGTELEVHEGEVLGLLGRNGMGKSTLVHTICGVAPPVMTRGEITFEGHRLNGEPSHVIARRGIGLVPQGRGVFGSLTVEENLDVVRRNGPGGDFWTLATVYDLFPRLAERRKQWANTLSGGEQQMLAMGRALMTNPRLLVMDEPSEGLAPAVLDLIRDRLRMLRETKQSVLMAEQNVDLVLGIADRVAILGEEGRIAWSGPATELSGDRELIHTHLGL